MTNNYIKSLSIVSVRNLKKVQIDISPIKKRHLILTGKNGIGKSTLLFAIRKFMDGLSRYNFSTYKSSYNAVKAVDQKISCTTDENEIIRLKSTLGIENSVLSDFGKEITMELKNPGIINSNIESGDFIICHFPADRNASFHTPDGVKKIKENRFYKINEKKNVDFIQFLVNQKANRSFARDDNDMALVKKIDLWFEHFQNNLAFLLGVKDIELKFDRNNYTYNIIEPNKEPYNFSQLSDGYSAILDIMSEIMMRMSIDSQISYDKSGIVLIDEIETHLHVKLQKHILPFLISYFPNIQFIVTTHSPFILTSVEDCVIYDLEKNFVTENLKDYSYSAIIESYFDSDEYSEILKKRIKIYEELIFKETLTEEEKNKIEDIEQEIKNMPSFLSPELDAKLQNLKLHKLHK